MSVKIKTHNLITNSTPICSTTLFVGLQLFIGLYAFVMLIETSSCEYLKGSSKIESGSSISWHEMIPEAEKLLLFGYENKDPNYEISPILLHQHTGKITNGANRGHRHSRRSIEFDPNKTRSDEIKETRKKLNEQAVHLGDTFNITFRAFDETFEIKLRKNSHLVSPDFVVKERLLSSDKKEEKLKLTDPNCFYHGYSETHPNSSVAISLCDGMRGIIETQSAVFVINPLSETALLKSRNSINGSHFFAGHPHVVLKKELVQDYPCPHSQKLSSSSSSSESPPTTLPPPSTSWLHNTLSSYIYPYPEMAILLSDKNKTRHKRATGRSEDNQTVVVETAVFVDETLYSLMKRTFPVDTEQKIVTYVLTIMNAVQLVFKQPSLGVSVEISVVLMDLLKAQPRDLTSSDNIDTYLTNFCVWQHNKRIHSRGLTPKWDHALLLSGINMYVVDGQGRKKRHVVGLAPVSGMCNSLNSCTISEGTSFQTVLVAAHEMGHSLGMEHDGNQDGNSCDNDNYIMSPTLGAGKTSWSSCSQEYLKKFIYSPQASCITSPSNHVNILNQFISKEKLPGQIFDAGKQCALRFGTDSRPSQLQSPEEVCRLLRCDTGSNRNVIAYHAHPALEGTSCGTNKWCRKGKCVSMEIPAEESETYSVTTKGTPRTTSESQVVNGKWGEWSPYSSCTSECVVKGLEFPIGLMVSSRKCDSPQPQNGGKHCDGADRRVRLCDAQQICMSSHSYRPLAIDVYINDICEAAALRDNNLEPRGTQYPSYDHSHSCYVWCHKKGGGYMTQGWKVPDGTPCGKEKSRTVNRYCVNGECRAFDCNGFSNEHFGVEPCPYITDGYSLQTGSLKNDNYLYKSNTWGPWFPVSSCRYACISESRGVRLVSRDCNLISTCKTNRESIQLCSEAETTCLISSVKSPDSYASDVCQKYRMKYPSLLSGRGRQLFPRSDNTDAGCVIACQDRVWRDIHYQMDAFEDGKFPLGTKCNLDETGLKGYCVNGKCMRFNAEDFPLDEVNEDDYKYVDYVLGVDKHNRRKRDTETITRSTLLLSDDEGIPQPYQESVKNGQRRLEPLDWKTAVTLRPITLSSYPDSGDILQVNTYNWVMAMSDCSMPCGLGHRNVTLFCQAGRFRVDDSLCDINTKPNLTGVRQECILRPCLGRWKPQEWSECSTSCGKGYQVREVLCIHHTSSSQLFKILDHHFCSPIEKPKVVQVCSVPC